MNTDVETFMKMHSPASKKSCMEKYMEQIIHLKNNGYSYPQIRDWLKVNEIEVTHQAVRQFTVRRIKEIATTTRPDTSRN